MCEFISWIEKDGEILFLTDAEIYSAHGRETLKGTKHNDVLGHGAIRAFYGITGGVEREDRQFWEAKLPDRLRKCVDEFDRHWGKTWETAFQNDDLTYIILYAPYAWQAKAWEQLLKQKPTNDDLTYIIIYAPYAWRAKAKALLKQIVTS